MYIAQFVKELDYTLPHPFVLKFSLDAVKYNDRLPATLDASRSVTKQAQMLLCCCTHVNVAERELRRERAMWRIKWWAHMRPAKSHHYLLVALRHANVLTEVL